MLLNLPLLSKSCLPHRSCLKTGLVHGEEVTQWAVKIFGNWDVQLNHTQVLILLGVSKPYIVNVLINWF